MSFAPYRRLCQAALTEAHRAKKELRAPGHKGPYHVSYLIRDEETHQVEARFGCLYAEEKRRARHCFADVRVGSHRYDHLRDGGLQDNSTKSEAYAYARLPIGNNIDGIRHGLWELTEGRYRMSAESLLEKRADELHYRNPNRDYQAFEKRPKHRDRVRSTLHEVDVAGWRNYVERASATARNAGIIHQSVAHLEVRNITRIYADSTDSLILESQPLWQLHVLLSAFNAEGVSIPWSIQHFVTDPNELPSLRSLRREIRAAIARIEALAKAPVIQSYAGPVLLDPKPAGLLMHEAIGHRLEGSRLLSQGEGKSFRDAKGSLLLPPMISMRDEPQRTHFEGKSLVGHYRYDDEGVEGQSVELIRDGVLKNFLSTRVGIARRHRSNGHARNASFERPISRMGVTIVESKQGISDAALKAALIEEIKARDLPYGLHILVADAGETATKAYDFQAFLGEIRLAKRIYQDGREEYVRGVNFVGTPLNAVRSIKAVGARLEVDNSYCGAESGSVPVSTISPALLIGDLEMQSNAKQQISPHTYGIPWAQGKR